LRHNYSKGFAGISSLGRQDPKGIKRHPKARALKNGIFVVNLPWVDAFGLKIEIPTKQSSHALLLNTKMKCPRGVARPLFFSAELAVRLLAF
jgi:hypothetical protein